MSFENVNAGVVITEPETSDGSLDNSNAGVVIILLAEAEAGTECNFTASIGAGFSTNSDADILSERLLVGSVSSAVSTSTPNLSLPTFTSFEQTVNQESASGWGNCTVRSVIPAAFLKYSGSRVSVQFSGGPSNAINISKAYICHKASSGAYTEFDGNQVKLQFSGNDAVDISANTTATSDEIDFDLDNTKPLIVSLYMKVGTLYISLGSTTSLKSQVTWCLSDYSGTTNPTMSTWASGENIACVSKINVISGEVIDCAGTVSVETNGFAYVELSQNGFTYRGIIPSSLIGFSGSKIKVLFSAYNGMQSINPYGAKPNKIYIGHQATSGDAYDFDGNQVELLFGGGHGFNINASQEKWSDETTFVLDNTKNLIISIYQDNSDSTNDNYPLGIFTGASGYYKSGDSAADTNPTGYNGPYGTYVDRLMGLVKIVVTEQSSAPEGSIVWGQITGVVENIHSFASSWTGTGEIVNTGDGEEIELEDGEYMECSPVNTGTQRIEIIKDGY